MLSNSDPSPWLEVFGRFHVVLLHLPIGLLPAMFVLEFGAPLVKRPVPRGALLALAVLTALAAALAFTSGLVLGGSHRGDADLIGKHKNFAIAMSAICVLLPFMAGRERRRPFRLGLAAGLALAIPTGHFGGSMTHGATFLWRPLRAEAEPVAAPPPADGDLPAPDASLFDLVVMPIFERACAECHGEDDPDGDLVLTTKAGVQCLDRDEIDRVVVPGRPDQSLLLERCLLPLDDDDHMPPADEPQLTPEELALLRAWILAGAPY